MRRTAVDSRFSRSRCSRPDAAARRTRAPARRPRRRHEATTTTRSSASGGCTEVEAPAARKDGGATEPKERLDPEKTYELVFKTNCGSFTVTLDLESAPATAASLVSLAKAGFFDDTDLPPDRAGLRDPGRRPDPDRREAAPATRRSTRRRPTRSTSRASSRWRRPAAEAPGTSGSQFFVVTGADVGLPPDYAIVGTVTDGMDTVDRIGRLGDPATEQPTQPVVIESVTVEEQ